MKIIYLSILIGMLAFQDAPETVPLLETNAAETVAAAASTAPAANFLERGQDFSIEEMNELIRKNENVFFLFHDPARRKGHVKSIRRMMRDISAESLYNSSLFVAVNTTNKEAFNISSLPSYEYHFKSYRKVYPTIDKLNDIVPWSDELIEIAPLNATTFDAIDDIDKHCFVLVTDEQFAANRERLQILAKMIHPLAIYHGFDTLPIVGNVAESLKASPLLYVAHNSTITPIDLSVDLNELKELIREAEFPSKIFCNEQVANALIRLKGNALIYVPKDSDQEAEIELLHNELFKYRNYFVFVIIRQEETVPACNFLKSFSQA